MGTVRRLPVSDQRFYVQDIAEATYLAMNRIRQLNKKEALAPFSTRRAIRHKLAIEQLYIRAICMGCSCSHYSNRRKGYMDDDLPLEVGG